MATQSLCLALPGQDCTDLYTAVDGDGCFSIATQFGFSLDILEANNGGADFCNTIQVGDVRVFDSNKLRPGLTVTLSIFLQVICVASTAIPYS